jgi:hypothetical protein
VGPSLRIREAHVDAIVLAIAPVPRQRKAFAERREAYFIRFRFTRTDRLGATAACGCREDAEQRGAKEPLAGYQNAASKQISPCTAT